MDCVQYFKQIKMFMNYRPTLRRESSARITPSIDYKKIKKSRELKLKQIYGGK